MLFLHNTHGLMSCYAAPQAVAFGQGVAALLPQLAALTEILPAPTLAWKLKLLQEGNRCAAALMLSSHCLPCLSPSVQDICVRLQMPFPGPIASHGSRHGSVHRNEKEYDCTGMHNTQARLCMLTMAFQRRQLAPKLKNVSQRVLLLVGEGDWLIPSQAEGKRLETVLARCIVKVCIHLFLCLNVTSDQDFMYENKTLGKFVLQLQTCSVNPSRQHICWPGCPDLLLGDASITHRTVLLPQCRLEHAQSCSCMPCRCETHLFQLRSRCLSQH